MESFQAAALFELCKEIGRIVAANRGINLDLKIEEGIKENNIKVLTDHATTFGNLSLPMCKMHVERIIGKLKDEISFGEWNAVLDELYNRMADETNLISILSLSPKEAALYNPELPLFGQEVQSKYPSASYEIEEAAKCLALGRSTAAVFHLMRVLEIGIRAFARCLGIPDPTKPAEKNWAIILKNIWQDGIEKKWPMAADKQSADGAYFTAIYASLDAVKNPWRNATVHVESKYTADEAEHIFSSVNGFMRKLAGKIDENGNPKAS